MIEHLFSAGIATANNVAQFEAPGNMTLVGVAWRVRTAGAAGEAMRYTLSFASTDPAETSGTRSIVDILEAACAPINAGEVDDFNIFQPVNVKLRVGERLMLHAEETGTVDVAECHVLLHFDIDETRVDPRRA